MVEKSFIFLAVLRLMNEKQYEVLLRKKKMLSLLQVMAHSLLVSILRIYIISYLQVRLKVE